MRTVAVLLVTLAAVCSAQIEIAPPQCNQASEWGDHPYCQTSDGYCEDAGLAPVANPFECNQFAAHYERSDFRVSNYYDRPWGCTWHTNFNHDLVEWWHSAQSGPNRRPCGAYNMACICRVPRTSTASPITPPPSPAPTAGPTTAIPSQAPTRRPTRHACDDGTHGCDATRFGICEEMPDSRVGYRCSCVNTHHCDDGDCSTAGHSCVRTTQPPTPGPTSTPTRSPTSAVPTAAPTTLAPTTAFPTSSGSLFHDAMTRSELLGLLQCNNLPSSDYDSDLALRQQLFQRQLTACPPPTAAPTIAPTAAADAGASGSAADRDESSDATAGSGTTLVVVIIVMVVLVIAVVVIAMLYIAKAKKGPRNGGAAGFDNPMYATTTMTGSAQQADDPVYSMAPGTAATGRGKRGSEHTYEYQEQQPASGGAYMDVPAAETGSSGYVDVPPTMGQQEASGYMDVSAHMEDNDEEDV